jgi:hypothetical protein
METWVAATDAFPFPSINKVKAQFDYRHRIDNIGLQVKEKRFNCRLRWGLIMQENMEPGNPSSLIVSLNKKKSLILGR